MSPQCTGNPDQRGVWVCPYCAPCSKPRQCFSFASTDDGPVKVSCEAPCTHAGFHGKDPGELWEHIQEAHGWDGKSAAEEPPRPLDRFVAPAPKRRLPIQKRGPSKAARKRARAKRKKRKKR